MAFVHSRQANIDTYIQCVDMYTCIDGAHSHNDIGIENTTTIDNESSRQQKSERESAKEKGSAKRERRSTVRKGERQINLYTHTWSRTKSLYFIFGTFYSFKWSKQRNTRKKTGKKYLIRFQLFCFHYCGLKIERRLGQALTIFCMCPEFIACSLENVYCIHFLYDKMHENLSHAQCRQIN